MTKIELVKITGFRNYRDASITVSDQTLIIGANDIGKTNFLYALRLLFDKKISESDLELFDSDYNIYTEDKKIVIEAHITDITEDCLFSIFKGMLKDGKTIIRLVKERGTDYTIYCGYNEATMEQFSNRFYLRALFMEYVDTNRDLDKFIKKEKNILLSNAKKLRSALQTETDNSQEANLQIEMNKINHSIEDLSYIKGALDLVNKELKDISIHHKESDLFFSTSETDMSKVLSDVNLSYKQNEQKIGGGGDGKSNQIFMATWIAKQNSLDTDEFVCFFAIEEPEAHLHPHQQRKLSSYVTKKLNSQIFITSHSPYIGTDFLPQNIVRLVSNNNTTVAASGGASEKIQEGFDEFGYRLNLITSDLFFIDGIFLVEGPSERILYKALCEKMEIDLDFYNISIVSTDGVGFEPYINMCRNLEIPFVLRTDNDIFYKSRKEKHYHYNSGINRLSKLFKDKVLVDVELFAKIDDSLNEWEISSKDTEKIIPPKNREYMNTLKSEFENHGLFVSEVDLEIDLINELASAPQLSWTPKDKDLFVKKLKEKKATHMYSFVQDNLPLDTLKDKNIMLPIKSLLNSVHGVDI